MAGPKSFFLSEEAHAYLVDHGTPPDAVLAEALEKLKREWVAARAEDRPFVNPLEPQTLRWRS